MLIKQHTMKLGSESETFYTWDLTKMLAANELNHVPVEICNEICVLQGEPQLYLPYMEQLDMICSRGRMADRCATAMKMDKRVLRIVKDMLLEILTGRVYTVVKSRAV